MNQAHDRSPSRSPREWSVWWALSATTLPGLALVIAGLLVLRSRERSLRAELQGEVDRQAGFVAAAWVDRVRGRLEDFADRLTRGSSAVAGPQDEFVRGLVRAPGDLTWRGMNESWPATIPLPLDRRWGGLLRELARNEVRDPDPNSAREAANAYRQLRDNLLEGSAEWVQAQLREAAACRRVARQSVDDESAGWWERALAIYAALAEPEWASALAQAIPVALTANVERVATLVEFRDSGAAEAEEQPAGVAADLLGQLDRGEVALPAGQRAAHLRLAWGELSPVAGEQFDATGSVFEPLRLEGLAMAERQLAPLQGLRASLRLLRRDPAEERTLLCVQTDATGQRAWTEWIRLDQVAEDLPRPSSFRVVVETEPPPAAELAASASLDWSSVPDLVVTPDLAGLGVQVSSSEEWLQRRLAPWTWSVTTAVVAITIASILSGFFAVRAVRRRLEVARLQRDLVTSISHELRTPLTSMLLHLELADDPRADDATRRDSVHRVRGSAGRLQTLIDRVLAFSRADRSAVLAEREATSASSLFERVKDEVEPLLGERSLTLQVDQPEIAVWVDPEAAIQVLVGLLENACKYAGETASMILRARPSSRNRISIEVEDDGPGLLVSERERVFEPFFRSPRHESQASGTGLGLAIARRLVETQGGRIRCEAAREHADRPGLRVVIEWDAAIGAKQESEA